MATGDLASHPLRDTKESKEITDKIHRLIRKFSRDLVDLVYQELGARAVVIKGKPGPKRGHKARRGICPLCQVKENTRRKFGFICKDCSAGKDINRPEIKQKLREMRAAKRKARDRLGEGFAIKIAAPAHIPEAALKPTSPEIEDAEPAFLDTLLQIVPEEKPAETPAPVPAEVDEEFWS